MKSPLIILAILSLPAFAQETHLDIKVPGRVEHNFFGPVKKVVTEYNYDLSDRRYKEERNYDVAGNLASKTQWDSKGNITYFATNTFDEAGCFINQRVENLRENTTNDYKIVLNIPSRKMAYCDKMTGEVEVLEYGKSNYLMAATIKEKGKRTLPLSAYKRDADSKKQLYTRYNEKGRVKYTIAYEWNEQQLKSRTLVTDKKKNSKTLNVYDYLQLDEHGNWTQCLLQCFDMKKKRSTKNSPSVPSTISTTSRRRPHHERTSLSSIASYRL